MAAAEFKLQRLPSVEDVYLLHAVATENPKDERLFAVAEVRDLTPVRDKSGRIVHLPHLERMLAEACGHPAVSVEAPAEEATLLEPNLPLCLANAGLKPDEVNDIVHRLAPLTDGLGLEQVVVRVRIPNPRTGELRDTVMRVSAPGDAGC